MSHKDSEESVVTLDELDRLDLRERDTEPPDSERTSPHHAVVDPEYAADLRNILGNVLDDKLKPIVTNQSLMLVEVRTFSGRLAAIEQRLGLSDQKFATLDERLERIEQRLEVLEKEAAE